MKGRFTVTLLAAALIFGQLALAQHVYDLTAHEENEACELCLLSASHAQALVKNPQTIEVQPNQSLTGRWQDLLNLQLLSTAFLARAPPSGLLAI